jgi:hypothetical protein
MGKGHNQIGELQVLDDLHDHFMDGVGHHIEAPCSPAEGGTGNLPNFRELFIVIRSLSPAL